MCQIWPLIWGQSHPCSPLLRKGLLSLSPLTAQGGTLHTGAVLNPNVFEARWDPDRFGQAGSRSHDDLEYIESECQGRDTGSGHSLLHR